MYMLKDALSNARIVTTPHAQSPFNAHWVPCAPCIFVQMGHQLVPGGVVVGPDGGRATLGSLDGVDLGGLCTIQDPYRELPPYIAVPSNEQSVLSSFIIDDGSFCV